MCLTGKSAQPCLVPHTLNQKLRAQGGLCHTSYFTVLTHAPTPTEVLMHEDTPVWQAGCTSMVPFLKPSPHERSCSVQRSWPCVLLVIRRSWFTCWSGHHCVPEQGPPQIPAGIVWCCFHKIMSGMDMFQGAACISLIYTSHRANWRFGTSQSSGIPHFTCNRLLSVSLWSCPRREREVQTSTSSSSLTRLFVVSVLSPCIMASFSARTLTGVALFCIAPSSVMPSSVPVLWLYSCWDPWQAALSHCRFAPLTSAMVSSAHVCPASAPGCGFMCEHVPCFLFICLPVIITTI